MSCEYCNGSKAFEDTNDIDIYYVAIDDECGSLDIEVDFGNRDCNYYEYFKINFCPMCGREF